MVNEIVRNHTMSHDMKTMLSDKRVKFSYFDVFETDYGVLRNVTHMKVSPTSSTTGMLHSKNKSNVGDGVDYQHEVVAQKRVGDGIIRVFSVFANYMEFVMFYIAVWSVVFSTTVA